MTSVHVPRRLSHEAVFQTQYTFACPYSLNCLFAKKAASPPTASTSEDIFTDLGRQLVICSCSSATVDLTAVLPALMEGIAQEVGVDG